MIRKYIEENISFNQETTLSGRIIINNINKAKQSGFYVVMNYLGVESIDIAKERVVIRVSKGGHGIPDDAIERRYYDSLNNLLNLIDVCDEINIYDNTDIFKLVGSINNGNVIWRDKKVRSWARGIL